MGAYKACLPPFLVAAIDNMEDVSVVEGDAFPGTVRLLVGIVVKQGSDVELPDGGGALLTQVLDTIVKSPELCKTRTQNTPR